MGLSEGQRRALEAMMSGANVFLTGHAGTGKSYVLDEFLRRRGGGDVLVCAPTGIAALNIRGGTTVHRAFKLRAQDAYDPTRPSHHPHKELLRARTVVIDEVSMVRVDLFDHIMSMVMEAERKSEEPKQVVLVGDFCQLPPVLPDDAVMPLRTFYPELGRGYCFSGVRWGQLALRCVVLDEVIRQTDPMLVSHLDEARMGDPACLPYFNAMVREEVGEEAVRIVPRNAAAATINGRMLRSLPGQERKYRATSVGTVSSGDKAADGVLELKPGARVVSLLNDPQDRYQNGTCGTVTSCRTDDVTVMWDGGERTVVGRHTWDITRPVIVRDAGAGEERIDHETIGSFTQLPLRLAWAVTVHKSQGQSYDRAHVDPRCFEVGQLYVALSRARSAEGLTLACEAEPRHLAAASEVVRFYEGLEGGGPESPAGYVAMMIPEHLVGKVRELIGDDVADPSEGPAVVQGGRPPTADRPRHQGRLSMSAMISSWKEGGLLPEGVVLDVREANLALARAGLLAWGRDSYGRAKYLPTEAGRHAGIDVANNEVQGYEYCTYPGDGSAFLGVVRDAIGLPPTQEDSRWEAVVRAMTSENPGTGTLFSSTRASDDGATLSVDFPYGNAFAYRVATSEQRSGILARHIAATYGARTVVLRHDGDEVVLDVRDEVA